MDFFEMNFSDLFNKKHGNDVYNKICKIIKQECPNNYNENYVELIFRIALLSYWGLNNSSINKMISTVYLVKQIEKNINIKNIKKVHKTSIEYIIKYLEDSENFQNNK